MSATVSSSEDSQRSAPLYDSSDPNIAPRRPGYILRAVETEDELWAAADAAVLRSGGRGALGPIEKGARILVVTSEDQDDEVFGYLERAMRDTAGAASVRKLLWSELGVPTGTFSAADGWRELSEEHVETVIEAGERVEQDALIRFLEKESDFTAIYGGDAGEGHFKVALGDVFKANWMYRKREDLFARYTNFPAQLQRLLEQRLIATFGRAAAVHITDPEGTDLRWEVTRDEAELWMRGSWIPWHIIGTTIEAVRFAQVRPSFGGTREGSLPKVIDRGRLTVLDDPVVRRVASLIADPDVLLAYDWIPAIPGINHPGDYERDYAPDPVPWIRRDVAGEFATAIP